MDLLSLFLVFFRIGFLAFGGGWSIVGIISRTLAERGWMTAEEFSHLLSVAQMTPGPVAVNVATYTGFRLHGVSGALLSTLGVILPPVIVLTTVLTLGRFLKPDERRLSSALRVGGASLIVMTFGSLLWGSRGDPEVLVIALVSFFLFARTRIDPVVVILGAALAGAAITALKG